MNDTLTSIDNDSLRLQGSSSIRLLSIGIVLCVIACAELAYAIYGFSIGYVDNDVFIHSHWGLTAGPAAIVSFGTGIFGIFLIVTWRKKRGHMPSSTEKFSEDLLSADALIREDSLDRARSLASEGNSLGLVAIIEAIRVLSGNSSLSFPKLGVGAFTIGEANEAEEKIIELLRSNRFLDDMTIAKNLLVMYSTLHNRDTRPLGLRVERELGDAVFRRLQLVDECFSIAALLRKVTGKDCLSQVKSYECPSTLAPPKVDSELKEAIEFLSSQPEWQLADSDMRQALIAFAKERLRKKQPAGTNVIELACDICSTKVIAGQGYALTTPEVLSSSSYWEFFVRRHPEICSGHGPLISFFGDRAADKTAWFVCEACSSMFEFDRAAARQYASEGGRHPSARSLTKEETIPALSRALKAARLPDPSTSKDGIMAVMMLLQKIGQ